MNNHDNISEELLARYLAETATESEIILVQNWLALSPSNARELADYKTIWEYSGSLQQKNSRVNTDAAWNKVKLQMEKSVIIPIEKTSLPQSRVLNSKTNQRKLPVTMWAAAVIALLVMAYGCYLFQNEKGATNTLQVATTNNTTEKILPDGTKVFLNYN